MRFGTDPSQVAVIQWLFAREGAQPLGFSTPFVVRNMHEVWPPVGMVQFSPQLNTPLHLGESLLPGTAEPCGDPAVWANGYQGTVPPNYPRNVFGEALCCGGTMGPARIGVLGYIPLTEQGLGNDAGTSYIGNDDASQVLGAQ